MHITVPVHVGNVEHVMEVLNQFLTCHFRVVSICFNEFRREAALDPLQPCHMETVRLFSSKELSTWVWSLLF